MYLKHYYPKKKKRKNPTELKGERQKDRKRLTEQIKYY